MTEETLGRRIAAHRKELGLTQDALAERVGVTAQAVSKWENDQSCPDISLLPRLAEIFGITIDALLGVERKITEDTPPTVPEEPESAAVVSEMPEGKATAGVALWLLLTGTILLVSRFAGLHTPGIWQTLGLSGLIVFGLFGLYPRFSVFRLGCAAAGGYYLYAQLFQPAVVLNEELLIPVLLVFLGISLLSKAVRREKLVAEISIVADQKNHFERTENTFSCSTCFGDDERIICLPVLESGEANLVFGELAVDLHDCRELKENACVALRCCFGNLTLYVPRQWKLLCVNRTVFGSVQEIGTPDADAGSVLRVQSNAVFGEIQIKYI